MQVNPIQYLYTRDTSQDWALWESLPIDDWSPEGQNYFITQPGKFALCGEGMNIAKDAGQPVSPDYATSIPFEFETPSELKQVTVTIKNDADEESAEKVLAGMLWRD